MSKLARKIHEAGRPLFGTAVYSYNTAFVEMAAMYGYDAVWFEMEHLHISFEQAADMCRIASGLGLLTMIRIPDSSRQTVLRAAECGPDILDLPMVNTPDVAAELVRHAKYPPIGNRGLFGSSRASRYTIFNDTAEEQMRINEELCLMVQIETLEASRNADYICSVPGLDAIFLGPGDMSLSCGYPGDLKHPIVREALCRALRAAESHNLIRAMMTSQDEVSFWVGQNVQILFITSDIQCLKTGLKSSLDLAMEQV